ncbi:MAG: hypothetical protein AB8B48_00515 [Pseudomonadales bacterium]
MMTYREKPISENSGIRAERGEALIDQVQQQRRSSMPQFVAAMLVMLFACGLAFGAVAADAPVKPESSAQEQDERQVKRSSAFCIFGIDDIKLRPSAGRMKGEERKPLHNENGDCWMDKPGQMA